jgi:nucleoside-diphosphate-sugar epimerase
MQDTAANVAKADALLDWRPVTSPEEGFKFTAEWHARESEWLDGIQL